MKALKDYPLLDLSCHMRVCPAEGAVGLVNDINTCCKELEMVQSISYTNKSKKVFGGLD